MKPPYTLLTFCENCKTNFAQKTWTDVTCSHCGHENRWAHPCGGGPQVAGSFADLPKASEEDLAVAEEDSIEEIEDALRDVFISVHDRMLAETDDVLESILSSAENALASARQAMHAYKVMKERGDG